MRRLQLHSCLNVFLSFSAFPPHLVLLHLVQLGWAPFQPFLEMVRVQNQGGTYQVIVEVFLVANRKEQIADESLQQRMCRNAPALVRPSKRLPSQG